MSDWDQASDRLAIIELYGRYNWAVDSADGDAFASTFTADGAFIGSIGSMKGAAELKAFAVSEALDKRGLQHWNSNIVIDFVSRDEVQSRAYMLALVPSEKAPVVERAGRYQDRVVRSGEGWRFAERIFSRQVVG